MVHLVLPVQLVRWDRVDHKDFQDIRARKVNEAILDHLDYPDNQVKYMKRRH